MKSFYEKPEFALTVHDLDLHVRTPLIFKGNPDIIRVNQLNALENGYSECLLRFYKDGNPYGIIHFSNTGRPLSTVLVPKESEREYIIKDPKNFTIELIVKGNVKDSPNLPIGRLYFEHLSTPAMVSHWENEPSFF